MNLPVLRLTDVELLERIALGEAALIGTLYDRYAATLFPTAVRIVRSHEEAEDVLHDAFLIVAERAGQYRADRGPVWGWLVVLVRNLSLDRLRRGKHRGSVRDRLAHEPATPVETPEGRSFQLEDRTRVRQAVARLPGSLKATLEVAFFEGLSYAEIAAREGVPLGTIKSRVSRGMASLRKALRHWEPHELG